MPLGCFRSHREAAVEAATEDLAVTEMNGVGVRAVSLAGRECDRWKVIFLSLSFLPCKMGQLRPTCLSPSEAGKHPAQGGWGGLQESMAGRPAEGEGGEETVCGGHAGLRGGTG